MKSSLRCILPFVRPHRAAAAALAFAGLALLCACSSPPGAPTLQAAAPAQWSAGGDAAGAVRIESGWWHGFGDPVLDALVARALAHNTDLRAATARVAQARALDDAQRADRWPSLDIGAQSGRSRSINAATGKPYEQGLFAPQFQASYEVDLWGRLSALDSAANSSWQASVAQRDAAALGVAATTVTAYIDLRAFDARLEIAQRTLAVRRSALELARSRESHGYSSALETAQSEAEYRATAQAIPQLQIAISRQCDALNLLTGAAPGPVPRGREIDALQALAPPALGLPSELLRRRPDIAGAEALVVASDERLRAARAALLPSVQLVASLGSVSSTALRGDPFKLWSGFATLAAPLLHGGALHAQVRASDARREEALAAYEKTVLTAFSEVEDQLASIDQLARQASEVAAQREALERVVHVASNRYREGYASYLDQLDAQRNLFGAEQSLVQLRAQRLGAQVALYRALGGGWEPAAQATAAAR